jgi:hypothetical protein
VRDRAQASLLGIFGVPLVIAVTGLIGLVTALLGDGLVDAFSWIGLFIPIVVIAWALRLRRL